MVCDIILISLVVVVIVVVAVFMDVVDPGNGEGFISIITPNHPGVVSKQFILGGYKHSPSPLISTILMDFANFVSTGVRYV